LSIRSFEVRQNILYYASVVLVFAFIGLSFIDSLFIPHPSNAYFTLLIILAVCSPNNIYRSGSRYSAVIRVLDGALLLFILDVIVTCTNTEAGRDLTQFWHSTTGESAFVAAVSLVVVYIGMHSYRGHKPGVSHPI
jgi:hypothetical protein